MPSKSPSVDLIRFGTSSFSSRDWVGNFYPDGTAPKDFLRHYAGAFDTVEVDASYYAIPTRQTVSGWVEKTPAHFLISAKFPRSIVHGGKRSTPDSNTVLQPDATYADRDRFLSVMGQLGRRGGPLILQFPYFAKRVFATPGLFLDRLDRFLEDLPRDFRYGVEIRNRTWLGTDLTDICRRHRVILVLVDQAWMPHADELVQKLDPITTNLAYVRLLGDRREIEAITTTWDRQVIDRSDRLGRWADYLVNLLEREIETLVYINNHYAGHAPTTARKLRELFRQRAAGRT
jgi:uncharacterized protein YecE (DUF72 family)